MRHYGAPTRLVDFTYSLFMAAYFASEIEKAEPVIWAVNKTWLSRHWQNRIKKQRNGKSLWGRWAKSDGSAFAELFLRPTSSIPTVCPVNPTLMNERLLVQQGVFLAVHGFTRAFHDVLDATSGQ